MVYNGQRKTIMSCKLIRTTNVLWTMSRWGKRHKNDWLKHCIIWRWKLFQVLMIGFSSTFRLNYHNIRSPLSDFYFKSWNQLFFFTSSSSSSCAACFRAIMAFQNFLSIVALNIFVFLLSILSLVSPSINASWLVSICAVLNCSSCLQSVLWILHFQRLFSSCPLVILSNSFCAAHKCRYYSHFPENLVVAHIFSPGNS